MTHVVPVSVHLQTNFTLKWVVVLRLHGIFCLVKISRNFGSAVNGKHSLVCPTGKFLEKVKILKRSAPRLSKKSFVRFNMARDEGLFILNWYHMVAHNCHSKTKNLTAKTKYLTAKAKTNHPQQKQIPTAKPKLFCFCCEVLVLLWGFWFCREVFCFCCEVFGFAVTVVGHHSTSFSEPKMGRCS